MDSEKQLSVMLRGNWREMAGKRFVIGEYYSEHCRLKRYRSETMRKTYLPLAFLTCVLGFSPANAVPSLASTDAKIAAASSTSSVAPQPVNGWWFAVPLVIGGMLILEHEHHHRSHYRRRCYRC
jgi:hypothetical protein